MSDTLAKATITLVDRTTTGRGRQQKSTERDVSAGLALDFNPETLTIKIQNATEKKGQRTNQRVQYVGSSFATLSFDAIFDSTRPRDDEGAAATGKGGTGGKSGEEDLDVRKRTRALAGLLDGNGEAASGKGGQGGGGGKGSKAPYPKLVRFNWGSVEFQGYVESYSEVLDFFSPQGVPLRAKVSVTLTEQSQRYHLKSEDRPEWSQAAGKGGGGDKGGEPGKTPGSTGDGAKNPGPASLQGALDAAGASIGAAKALAALNGMSDLMDLAGGVELGLGVDLGATVSATVGLQLGLGVNLGVSAQAGVSLDASAALDVFGGPAVQAGFGGSPDLGRTASAPPASPTVNRPGPWSPDGPAPGTRAHAIAVDVATARASASAFEPAAGRTGDFTATRTAPSVPSPGTPPTPVLGSPPTRVARFGPPPPGAVFGRVPTATNEFGRPSWERAPNSPASQAESRGKPHVSGCACCGGRR